MMLWGIDGPSYWRDEADTVSAVSRSFPQLIRLLGHVDAVHGLYYLLLWPVARMAGTGEIATRLPSALAMAAAAGAAVSPLAVVGWMQRSQIGWIPRPGWHDVSQVVISLAGGTALAAALIGLLAACGTVHGSGLVPNGAGRRRLAWLAVPWLVLPPAALLAASAIKPVYYLPYVAFCLPAVALLAGCGIVALAWRPRLAATVLLAAVITPAQLATRAPDSGGALGLPDQILAAQAQPGDAIVYPQGGIPPWYLAFPDGFGRLRDIGLQQPGATAGRLYGTGVTRPVLLRRECQVRRVWAAEIGPRWRDPAADLAPGFRLTHQWQPHVSAMRLWLYQQAGPPGRRC